MISKIHVFGIEFYDVIMENNFSISRYFEDMLLFIYNDKMICYSEALLEQSLKINSCLLIFIQNYNFAV